jgi:DNA polymerase-3 subunit alpha
MSFLKDFSEYKDCAPAGVKLPEINIEDRYYEQLGLDKNTSNYDFLRALCLNGVKNKKIDKKKNKQVYYDRVKEELEILRELGFIDYILLNWDILHFCHENDIPTGPGRGSAAGCLVLYLIGVTQVDPIKYDLFFERFVSKSRARKIESNGEIFLDGSLLADVDNDIAYERRAEVIDYIKRKHPNRTCKILTLNTLSGKLCVKECGKIVGNYSEQEVNEVSDSIPKRFGKVAPLQEAYNESEKFKDWVDKNQDVFKIARKLEGLNKNTGVHPSGIAISFYPLDEICPLQQTNDGDLVSGYDMNWVAELMVKFDILGLRTLSVIYDVCKQLDFDMDNVNLSDKNIYKPLKNNFRHPQGLFQIEAYTNFNVCKKIGPTNLEQLSAVVAIARPGALEFTDSYVEYVKSGDFQSVHPAFDEILDYTGGIPLYQEQLMKMAVRVGFTLDEAEQLRRIVGKKKVDQMPAWKEKIFEKVEENRLTNAWTGHRGDEAADVLWQVAEDSANYSFNKSHSIAYATLAAWTTYLKFKHPKEFFLSLLKMTQFEPAPHEEIAKITTELPYFGIELLPPDLGRSDMDFKIEGDNIRYGLNSIKGVSQKTLQALKDFRESETPTKYDIFISAKQAGINIGVLSALIQAGALNAYKTRRSRLVLEAQSFNLLTDREKRNFIQLGERFNFDVLKTIEAATKDKILADDKKRLMSDSRFVTFKKKYDKYKQIWEKNRVYEDFANWFFEKKLLGYSYSTKLKSVFSQDKPLMNSYEVEASENNERVYMVGVVDDCFKRQSRNGNKYAKFDISDELGFVNGILLDTARQTKLTEYLEQNNNKLPKKESVVYIEGRKGDGTIFLDKVSIYDDKIYMKLSDLK